MNINDMLRQLQDERNRLDQAISALQGLDSTAPVAAARRGRPPGKSVQRRPRGRRRMSAAARAKIAAAQRARWAKQKGTAPANSASAKKSAPAKRRRRMSAAGRKRISEAAKAMWAARKKAKA
jgi:hypothetical protein